MSFHLGFDIGGTKCAVLLGRTTECCDQPEVLAKRVFATSDFATPDATLDHLLNLAHEISSDVPLKSAGVSCGGPLDSRRGVVLSPPNLPDWDAVPVVRMLSEHLRVPVKLQNDANAGALAEWFWGAARGTQTALFLTFGTGLGAGLIINGRLHEGPDDLAGEIGHWRLAADGPEGYGKSGSWEGFCSGGGMARLARERIRGAWARNKSVSWCASESELATLGVLEMAQAARQGEPLAQEIFIQTGEKLGTGLALLVDLLNPEAVVIGSIFARCEDLLRAPMQVVLERECLPSAFRRCVIRPAALGESIGDYAALAVAANPTL